MQHETQDPPWPTAALIIPNSRRKRDAILTAILSSIITVTTVYTYSQTNLFFTARTHKALYGPHIYIYFLRHTVMSHCGFHGYCTRRITGAFARALCTGPNAFSSGQLANSPWRSLGVQLFRHSNAFHTCPLLPC